MKIMNKILRSRQRKYSLTWMAWKVPHKGEAKLTLEEFVGIKK